MKLFSKKGELHSVPGLGPDAIEVDARRIRVDDTWCATLVVTGYPREVRSGWLEPLLSIRGAVDVSVHVEPMDAGIAADRLRKQLARLESTRRVDAEGGRLADPLVDVAAEDARTLAHDLARGDVRLFRVGIAVAVRAKSTDNLDALVSRVRSVLSSLLVDVRPTTFRSLAGWLTTQPLGVDHLGQSRTFDTSALAATYPFPPAELSEPDGVFYGANRTTGGLVFWDRFSQDNYNSVILARSGAGKSYLAKLEVLRNLIAGVEVAVVDPEDEYQRLVDAVEGAYVHLGGIDVRLNPFDVGGGDDAVVRQSLFIHSLVSVLTGSEPDATAKAALDRALVQVYGEAGITRDARTHRRAMPTMADLHRVLSGDPEGRGLAARLTPFVIGNYRGLFDGQTTTQPESHLVVYSLRDVPEELKAAATMVVLDRIWQRVSNPADRRRRMVTIDEAWLLMRDPAGARFVFRLAKSARKYWCAMNVVTQDAADLLGTEVGQAVVANAATQILLRQAPQAIDRVVDAFKLSEGERSYLLTADRGDGIIVAGAQRVPFRALASPSEHRLVTSDPAELAADIK